MAGAFLGALFLLATFGVDYQGDALRWTGMHYSNVIMDYDRAIAM